jgi:DNA recombination protein RmuC
MEYILLILAGGEILLAVILLLLVWRNGAAMAKLSRTIDTLDYKLARLEQYLPDEVRKNRQEAKDDSRAFRNDVSAKLTLLNDSLLKRMNEMAANQAAQLKNITDTSSDRLEKVRDTVDNKLNLIRADNSARLEEMRLTVDEKLNATLEKRLGESFKLVSQNLTAVHKGLGEMQTLAAGVGDLKRVLSNVKTRGIWGEIQLGRILEEILTPQQYAKNIATVPNSRDRVEFALRIPSGAGDIWLPIDAKFPQEDYRRLIAAQEAGDAAKIEEYGKALEVRLKAEAKDIAEKYIAVPHTTEFGILFLPIEGLYAEVLRRDGLCEFLQQKYRIVLAGPTTLAALLNSLQMGFRTFAIEKRSVEVWQLLGEVKREFGKFGDLLDKTHRKLQEASSSIDTAAKKSRTIERSLKDVAELPARDEKLFIKDEE